MRILQVLCVGVVFILAPLAARFAASTPSVPQANDSAARPETASSQADAGKRDRMLAEGKRIFVDRCARCHGERGDKPLSTGLPLSQRKLSPEYLARTVNGRLKDSPEEQRRAVQLYIESFLNPKPGTQSPN